MWGRHASAACGAPDAAPRSGALGAQAAPRARALRHPCRVCSPTQNRQKRHQWQERQVRLPHAGAVHPLDIPHLLMQGLGMGDPRGPLSDAPAANACRLGNACGRSTPAGGAGSMCGVPAWGLWAEGQATRRPVATTPATATVPAAATTSPAGRAPAAAAICGCCLAERARHHQGASASPLHTSSRLMGLPGAGCRLPQDAWVSMLHQGVQ